jgi:polyhydroxyalkanoate synthesis repressor PhaR
MTRLIKKYKNRRLYDSAISQFVTVDDLKQYVIDGVDFRVEAVKSGEDVTSATLLQIMVDMEGGASQLLSADFLRELIKLANHPLSQSFKIMLDDFLKTLSNYRQQNPLSVWDKQMNSFYQTFQDAFKKK